MSKYKLIHTKANFKYESKTRSHILHYRNIQVNPACFALRN